VPAGPRPGRDLLAILAAHGVPYAATACVAYPDDLLAKVRKARAVRGTRFLQILAPCPPGWETAADATIELGRLAVQSRVFPLLEVEDGERWRFTVEHAGTPVQDYLRRQGRFRHLGDADHARLQQQVDARWTKLERRVRLSAEP
jgi:pyruvate/2-oxoacid:ferredoxin oxidoreductase beta subunit